MGPHQHVEPKLFYTGISLGDRVPEDHLLRQIRRHVDFEFVRRAVQDCYGYNGQESVDPIVLMKLMILLYLEQIPSERELMRRLPYRLDWLWFCGYDFDDMLPNHSVLSKARRRWGPAVFEELFTGILQQCMEAGLVGGEILHVDGSCIQGDVDMARLQPVLRRTGQELYQRLDEGTEPTHPSGSITSRSDPEAGVTNKNGRTICGYKDHRAVDDAEGIITATVTTDAAKDEGQMLEAVLDAHEQNGVSSPATVVADTQYGTAENYGQLHDRGVTPCIPHQQPRSQKGRFGHNRFAYDAERDCFVCPAGQTLQPYHRDRARRRVRYRAAPGTCVGCKLRGRCTTSKSGRRVERHMDQECIDWADGCLSLARRRRLMARRKVRAEGSFADAANVHGFKRARWRGLVNARIQNLLITSLQNLRKLLKSAQRGRRAACAMILGSVDASLRSTRCCELRRISNANKGLTLENRHRIGSSATSEGGVICG